MTVLLWIINILLATTFAAAGVIKLTRSRPELIEMGMGWVEDTSLDLVRAIGAIELVGVAGLVVPEATGIVPLLTPIAAIGLATVMLAAVVVHLNRDESFVVPLALGGIAVVSAVIGFAVI